MKILAVKLRAEDSGIKAGPPPKKVYGLDRLCNGLLSRARYHGRFWTEGNNSQSQQLVWFRPVDAHFDHVFFWNSEKAFPWKNLAQGDRDAIEIFFAGEFDSQELKQGWALFPRLAEWKDLDGPQVAAGAGSTA